MYKFRFKTEQEFIKEYGIRYSEMLYHYWNRNMNIFFGKQFYYKIDKSDSEAILNGIIFSVCSYYPDKKGRIWLISSDMLIQIKPNYNSKKKIERII